MRSFDTLMGWTWTVLSIYPFVTFMWRMVQGRPVDDYAAYTAWFVASAAAAEIFFHKAQDD
jgi:hypothetical protein